MNPAIQLYAKLTVVALVVVGIFVLAALGRVDAVVAMSGIVATVTGLTIALGISGAGASVAQSMLKRPTPPVDAPKADERGFALVSLVAALAAVCVAGLVALAVAGCASAVPTPKAVGCGARYQACVASSADMPAYIACRAQVDAACLDGGAP